MNAAQKQAQIEQTLAPLSKQEKQNVLQKAHLAVMQALGLDPDGPIKLAKMVFEHDPQPHATYFQKSLIACNHDEHGRCLGVGH